MTSARVLI